MSLYSDLIQTYERGHGYKERLTEHLRKTYPKVIEQNYSQVFSGWTSLDFKKRMLAEDVLEKLTSTTLFRT